MNSQAGSDAAGDVKKANDRKEKFDSAVEKTKEDNEAFSEYLQVSVNKNSNPHPVVIAILIFAIIVILYFVYGYFQQKITGVWIDPSGNKYLITKKDVATVVFTNKDTTFTGTMEKNVIDLEGGLGLWDGKNMILLPSGVSLYRKK